MDTQKRITVKEGDFVTIKDGDDIQTGRITSIMNDSLYMFLPTHGPKSITINPELIINRVADINKLNLIEVLKYAGSYSVLYSITFGEIKLVRTEDSASSKFPLVFKTVDDNITFCRTIEGKAYSQGLPEIYPSKESYLYWRTTVGAAWAEWLLLYTMNNAIRVNSLVEHKNDGATLKLELKLPNTDIAHIVKDKIKGIIQSSKSDIISGWEIDLNK